MWLEYEFKGTVLTGYGQHCQTEDSWETLSWLVKQIGGAITPRYSDHNFMKQAREHISLVLAEEAVIQFKAARGVALYWDIGASFLLIRVGVLTAKGEMRTYFWQARAVALKTAQSLFKAICNAFKGTLHPMMAGNEDFELSEEELFRKLKVGVADGASENGVRKKGKMLEQADEGENVMSYLQAWLIFWALPSGVIYRSRAKKCHIMGPAA